MLALAAFYFAIEEAKRLARASPGCEFHVLELVGTAKKVDVEFLEANDANDIPY